MGKTEFPLQVKCGRKTVGGLVPPSVVSAMVGGEHISTFGDNKVDFESFFVVLILTVSGGVLKKDYEDAIHQQAQVLIVYWDKEKHHEKNQLFPFKQKPFLRKKGHGTLCL